MQIKQRIQKKQKKFLISLIVAALLVANTSPSLQAQADCVSFVHATMPVKFAHLPANARDLYLQSRTMLNQYQLGADLLASLVVFPLTIIPGSIYLAKVKKAYNRYCVVNDCECKSYRTTVAEDYWVIN